VTLQTSAQKLVRVFCNWLATSALVPSQIVRESARFVRLQCEIKKEKIVPALLFPSAHRFARNLSKPLPKNVFLTSCYWLASSAKAHTIRRAQFSPQSSRAPIFRQLFLHEDMVQSVQRNSVEQRSVCSKTYPNLSQITPLVPETVGTPSCSLSGKRDIVELHPATPHIDRILPFQVYRIYQETILQYFPNTCVSAPCSDISRCRNCDQNLPMTQIPPASPITTFDHTQISFLRCPSPNLLRGNPDLGRAFSKFTE
jgi:hypothetical protein